jgi:outer membrane protein TolC
VNLQQAFNSWVDAAQQSHVQQQVLQAAELRAEIARSQYTSGLMSFDDWDIIEDDLIAQQKTDLTARRDAILALAAWENARGVSLLPAP